MSKEEAVKKFYSYIKKDYGKVEVLDIQERDSGYLFDFIQEGDEFPVDYPVIYVNKTDGKVRELSYLNEEDSKLIFGDNNGKD